MQVNLCRHIKTNGLQCRGAAVEASVFCYFHNRLHRSHDLFRDKVHLESAQLAHPRFLQLPAVEDRESAQLAISTVLNALATQCISPKEANSLFYGLQIASANARGLRIVRRPTQMVRDVYKEPWVDVPHANVDIAPPGRTLEVEDDPTQITEADSERVPQVRRSSSSSTLGIQQTPPSAAPQPAPSAQQLTKQPSNHQRSPVSRPTTRNRQPATRNYPLPERRRNHPCPRLSREASGTARSACSCPHSTITLQSTEPAPLQPTTCNLQPATRYESQ